MEIPQISARSESKSTQAACADKAREHAGSAESDCARAIAQAESVLREPFSGITRSFSSFSQAAQENADSRVYAGIHFRSACQDGVKLGEQIGRRAFAQYLLAYRE
jgi:hypothetical protein